MSLATVAAVTWLTLSSFAEQRDTVEVTFRCPTSGQFYTVNWDSERKGFYYENGKSHDITFSGGGSVPVATFSAQLISRSGQSITCQYKSPQNWVARYSYDVNRTIISCTASQPASLKCKLQDNTHK